MPVFVPALPGSTVQARIQSSTVGVAVVVLPRRACSADFF